MKCLIQLAVLLACGCTSTGPQRAQKVVELVKVEEKVAQKASANAYATGLALQAAPQTNRAVAVAQTFNDKTKALLPKPDYEDIIEYEAIVAGLLSENEKQRAQSQKALGEADSEISTLLSERRVIEGRVEDLENRLIEYGAKYELERNKSWWTRIYSFLGFGGIIALVIAFPILIPIGGQVVGWVVNTVPSLASWVGLVSRKSFDSVVVAVESAKERMKTDGKEDAVLLLKEELQKATDAAHRKLIADRKQDLGL